MTPEEREALKERIRPKRRKPAIASAEEVAAAIEGRVVVGKPDRVGFDIQTNSVVTMQWHRGPMQGWERTYLWNPDTEMYEEENV
jgi:hypothetical protein